MKFLRTSFFVLLPLTLICFSGGFNPQAQKAPTLPVSGAKVTPEQETFFETSIRPLLAEKCYSCHSATDQRGGLRLDSREAMLKGNVHGTVLVPGDIDHSVILQVTSYTGKIQMPPPGKLRPAELAALIQWVKMGAPWPAAKPTTQTPAGQAPDLTITPQMKSFWSFVPVKKPALPKVQHAGWAISPVDRFILAKLEATGLTPAAAADRRTLIRRATVDLTGLVPAPADVDRFVNDKSPDAWSKVVDRLLASPQYGERWARHWLDLVRYADSNGLDENVAFANSYRYRDYVVDAFNTDKPYNDFITEQLAGDLLSAKNDAQRNAQLVATGFLELGPKVLAEPDKDKMVMDIVDEQIEVTSKAFMGLTVACARCHNHKFDPIPTKDYYALAGIFKSTRTMSSLNTVAMWEEKPLASAQYVTDEAAFRPRLEQAKRAEQAARDNGNAVLRAEFEKDRLKYLDAGWLLSRALPQGVTPTNSEQLAKERGLNAGLLRVAAELSVDIKTNPAAQPEDQRMAAAVRLSARFKLPAEAEKYYPDNQKAALNKAQADLKQLEASAPAQPMAMAAEEGKIADCRVHIRGDTQSLGDAVPRHFLSVLGGGSANSVPDKHSGRMELAAWLTRGDNPLTARVEVNRIWQDHFGTGLCNTPDNFGLLGERPADQQLLDWLAATFVEQGWSIKKLQRMILMSNTYKMACITDPARTARGQAADPEDRLLWRMPRRRMDADAFRDSVLFASGSLDTTIGGSLLKTKDHDYVTNDQSANQAVYDSPRRSIYLPIIRNALYDMFQAFDMGDPSMVNASRSTTTVAPQALFVMNSPFMLAQSKALARILGSAADADKVRAAYLKLYARPASDVEINRAQKYLADYGSMLATSVSDEAKRHEMALSSWCQILLASNAFIYVD